MMRTRSAFRKVLTLLLAGSLVAAACGDDDDAAGTPDVSGDATSLPTTEGDATSVPTTQGDATSVPTTGGDDTVGGPDGSAAPTTEGGEGGDVNREATMRIAYAVGIPTLDPHKSSFSITTWQVYQTPIYDRLFALDPGGEVVPQLAEEGSFSEDGTRFEVTLRDDVTFHDGSPVNAEAVVASVERAQTVEGTAVASVLEGITAEAVADYSVVFAGEGLAADISALLASNAGMIMNPAVFNDPAVNLDTAPPAGAGSGPYVVVESEPNVSTTYERSPSYWDPSAGNLAGFTIATVAQATTRLQGLQAGDFDLAQMTGDALQAAQAEADAGRFELFLTPSVTRDLYLNYESGDLADPEVRRAIFLGIDRDALDAAFSCRAHQGLYDAGHWAHNPDLEVSSDPETARQIIADRGGASFTIEYPAGSSVEPIVLVLQEQLGGLGFDITTAPVESFPMAEQRFISGDAQAIVGGIYPWPDPATTIENFFLGGPGLAKGEYRARIEAQALQAKDPALSQEERAEMYHSLFAEIAEEYLYVPVCQSVQGWGHTVPIIDIEAIEGYRSGTPSFSQLAVANE